jgi:hypothetical protein
LRDETDDRGGAQPDHQIDDEANILHGRLRTREFLNRSRP